MSESPSRKKHTLMLDDRKRLVLTGAEDVSGFNEETIAVKTSAGNL
ncbi:MAG: YabP/YqfC family sporulation protein, partial [Ruminococcus sp.]|nr:YabP/YqfC family sporulation protein [Ruminococcus sp.]